MRRKAIIVSKGQYSMQHRYRKLRITLLAMALATSASTAALARSGADIIFRNGIIMPMTGPEDKAEAVAVKDGKILVVGRDAEVAKRKDRQTRIVDLEGRALLPGFIDAHGHLAMVAQRALQASLDPPPVGPVSDIASLQAELRTQASKSPEGWIVGMGYDDAQLAERRHPTRQELDAVSIDRPILAIHVSSHLATLNTKGLELAGLLHAKADPPGGVIRREADGTTPSGVVEEAAMFAAMRSMPAVPLDTRIEGLVAAQRSYAANGLTTAQDGATAPETWELLKEAAERGALFLDVHALPLAMVKWDDLAALPFHAPYRDHLRVAGVKIMADGSPQGRTAWLSHPYHEPPSGRDKTYAGYPQITDDVLRGVLANAAGNGWQAYVHVNGDAAIQQLIDSVQAVKAAGNPLKRTIAIHAQTARVDQLRQMKTLDIEPSFFAAHTFFWGDWHREVVLGSDRADHISPQRQALDIGLRPTIHNDAPVVPPDMIRLIWSGVTRRTRSNDILGPAERVTTYEALEEVTRNAAYAIQEEAIKGTLEPGKLADFVILSANPLTLPKERLLELEVMATIKEGKYVFEK